MDKPTKPSNLMPRSFGGVKNNWTASMQSSGYEDGVPAIYSGDNLNYQLDATGKELDYCEKICDFINDIPIGKTITVDSNNKLIYENYSTVAKTGSYNDLTNKPTIPSIADLANKDLSNLTTTGNNKILPTQTDNSGKYLTTNGTSPSWTEFTGANKDLSNLTTNGNNRLHALKSYEDVGELLTDVEGLADVTSYAHSTFDLSKFTVVGSPTITDDGIASGFGASNYLKTPNINFSNNWTFETVFKTTDITTQLQPLLWISGINRIFISVSGEITYFINNVTGGFGVFVNTNINYKLKVKCENASTYTVTLTNLDAGTTTTNTKTIAATLPSGSYWLGSDGSRYLSGSIDLKQFSITVDGIPVFNGNQTGIDTYTINGSTVTIPYNLSKTGSKIVDSAYRDRVASVYEYLGYAPYYTLSDTDFTIPQGEIYGMIEKAKQAPIGDPIFTLSNTLSENEIWLEGATVNRSTYANLFAVYGTTYGAGDGSTTFQLPDFRNRTIWGGETFGYVAAGLPDHSHTYTSWTKYGAISEPRYEVATSDVSANTGLASASNSIYGNSTTVQPPSVKVRVKTRYK